MVYIQNITKGRSVSGCFNPPDILSTRMFFPQDVLYLRMFGPLDFLPLGRFVSRHDVSRCYVCRSLVPPDLLSRYTENRIFSLQHARKQPCRLTRILQTIPSSKKYHTRNKTMPDNKEARKHQCEIAIRANNRISGNKRVRQLNLQAVQGTLV